MSDESLYLLAADTLLVIHALFVLFVIAGLLLVIVGKFMSWQWVRNPWFRSVHLAAIGVVVAQAWLGIICPLTTWEMTLRRMAGQVAYEGTFVSYWVGRLLYYQAPMWVFAVAYTVFGALVVVSWLWVRPRRWRDK